ncbi:hypothetical protein [Spiroplasma eriocheiris]|uniref:Uncharacterized protein n=1 Tax=Spiroplasma eriocheiris TaxID=315358 RepID=A0A0H3XHH6_9MOLU|nr:hypothetical protein [Spiroplasma eriocheiris]AHF57706.1 hypothetical protein SPE_0578 [Spiroplasma eriocheiris CCTCC M 207170]AKM54158.1 hypothetical protein SERIO_v1c05870 [Spiroplasma eriocheiris]
MISNNNLNQLCKNCQSNLQELFQKIKQKKPMLLKQLQFLNVHIEEDNSGQSDYEIKPFVIFHCEKKYFGLFYKKNLFNNSQLKPNIKNHTVYLSLATIKQSANLNTIKEQIATSNLPLVTARQQPLTTRPQTDLVEHRQRVVGEVVDPPLNARNFDPNAEARQAAGLIYVMRNINRKLVLLFLIIILILTGIGVGGWQLFNYLNKPHTTSVVKTDITNDGGTYSQYQAIIDDTTNSQLKTAVQQISVLSPDLLSAIADSATVLSTHDVLQYDHQPHLMTIDINADNAKMFKGHTKVTMNIEAKKFDISFLSGDFTNTTPPKITTLNQISIIKVLEGISNLNQDLLTALQDPQIKIENISGQIPEDGEKHLVTFTINANDTTNYLGKINAKINLINQKFDIGKLKDDYTTDPVNTVNDLERQSLIQLILLLPDAPQELKNVVQETNVVLTPSQAKIPRDGKTYDLNININANKTVDYVGTLTIKVKVKNSVLDLGTLSQDLTSQPVVTEPDVKANELIDALQRVGNVNPILLGLLNQPGINVSTLSDFPHDGIAHKIGIDIQAEGVPQYTGQARVWIMMKSSKIDITSDGGSFIQFGPVNGNDTNTATLISALEQLNKLTPLNANLLAVLKDKNIMVTTDSQFVADKKPHEINITINTINTSQYEGVAKILLNMQST